MGRVNEFNVESVLALFLPYHDTPHFAKMVTILHIKCVDASISFVHNVLNPAQTKYDMELPECIQVRRTERPSPGSGYGDAKERSHSAVCCLPPPRCSPGRSSPPNPPRLSHNHRPRIRCNIEKYRRRDFCAPSPCYDRASRCLRG